MTHSYTQISQYLTCPRRYRHRYLDGWQEKNVRAAMLFGRRFEQALAALFRHEHPAPALFEQWTSLRTWSWFIRVATPGTTCSGKAFSCSSASPRMGASRFFQPRNHQQIRFTRTLRSGDSFVAFVDAVGELDSTACVLEWKTSSARCPEEPDGIAALDPQLVC
jgi:hypothetical protein